MVRTDEGKGVMEIMGVHVLIPGTKNNKEFQKGFTILLQNKTHRVEEPPSSEAELVMCFAQTSCRNEKQFSLIRVCGACSSCHITDV